MEPSDKTTKSSARGGRKHRQNATDQAGPSTGRQRGSKFNSSLTPASSAGSNPESKTRHWKRNNLPDGDDLTSNLIRGLAASPYTDCPICVCAIFPAQPTWSCSPLIEISSSSPGSPEQQAPEYCWTTFHLSCVRSWAAKSFKESQAAWKARGEPENASWRCPGCQGRRNILVDTYKCFCGSTNSPNSRLGIPHSCGNLCSRPRTSCTHPCPLQCHPGPCPPCKITRQVVCGCPKARKIDIRCCDDTQVSMTCGEVCSRPLSCGNPEHRCERLCHPGECPQCEKRERRRCWCQKEEREAPCGQLATIWRGGVGCGVVTSEEAKGFSCGQICGQHYACGIHECQKICHPTSLVPSECPFSPENVTKCPCGKRPITQHRTRCSSPIPTCDLPCMKEHSLCDHPCRFSCHPGDCPPCGVEIVTPCRCGATKKSVVCGPSDAQNVVCDKPCPALRACGRHQCNRICCPLAFAVHPVKGKGKKRAVQNSIEDQSGGLHVCDLVCGKMLACGNHRCEERDHRGPCAPCLRSAFEEVFCPCGRTVLEPPIPCGTQIQCGYPCERDPPPCGHPRTTHSCHSDETDCPPCVALTKKPCACGKKVVPNVKCSLEREKVGCGSVCAKLMSCGFHRCERLCHAGDCGTCTSPCGKPRKMCLPLHHPCPEPCHAPAHCPEDTPCRSLISLSCPCGRISQSVPCIRSTSNPVGRSDTQQQQQQPKCTPECGIAKRNARLADALGIDTEARERNQSIRVTYADDLVNFAKRDSKFVLLVEKAFNDFVSSGKKSQVLPHMPVERRKFVIELASVYRIDTQMVDQEPHRSVQLLHRIDSRVPSPVLSTYIASQALPAINLGKLSDLRTGSIGPWRTGPSSKPSSTRVLDSQPPRSSLATGTAVKPSSSAAASQTNVPTSWEDEA